MSITCLPSALDFQSASASPNVEPCGWMQKSTWQVVPPNAADVWPDSGFQLLPLVSRPCALSWATARFARSVRYAPDAAFLITPNCFEIEAVRLKSLALMTPMPAGFGQISLLISFICQVW